MSLLIFVTTVALLMSETHYLVGDPIANAFRFGVMGLLVVMIAFRPRDRIALEGRNDSMDSGSLSAPSPLHPFSIRRMRH